MKRLSKIREDISMAQLNSIERYADNLLNKYGIDVEFTRHFVDRVNDDRNTPEIVADELISLFNKIARNRGKQIKKAKDIEAVIKDVTSNLNLPVVVDFNRRTGDIELVGKTIMRKRKFFTKDKILRYEEKETSEEQNINESYVGGFRNGFRYIYDYPQKESPGRADNGLMVVEIHDGVAKVVHNLYSAPFRRWEKDEYEVPVEKFENEILPYLPVAKTVEEIEAEPFPAEKKGNIDVNVNVSVNSR